MSDRELAHPSPSIDFYFLATRFMAIVLNWISWLLAVYVRNKFGVASAALFLGLALGSSIIVTALIPPMRIDLIAHMISLPATI
jgi:hypothetical protein